MGERVPKILLERVNNPEERGGGGGDVEMDGLPLFYYFAVQLHFVCVCVCGGGGGGGWGGIGSKVSFITVWIFIL